MPSLLKYIDKQNSIPKHLTFSLAALMAFYTSSEIRDNALVGQRNGEEYKVRDDKDVLEFFVQNSNKPAEEFVNAFLSSERFFGSDLTKIPGLADKVTEYLNDIRTNGMRTALQNNLK